MVLPKICTPAMVYLVIAAISLVVAMIKKFQFFSILVKALFIAVWTWFLNFLCSKGYKGVSWFLVVLPFLLMLGVFVMAMEVVKKATGTMTQQQQKEGLAMKGKK